MCKQVDLFPADLQDATEKLNELIYPCVNNGVYRCGFAKSQVRHVAGGGEGGSRGAEEEGATVM